jgi:DNA polymerase epsilon subunit 1
MHKAPATALDTGTMLQKEEEQDVLDASCGFPLYKEGPSKLGWLVNYNACAVEDKDSGQMISAVSCYFTSQTGEMFKCKLPFAPYFYLQVKGDRELEVEAYLRRKFEGIAQLHLIFVSSCIS